MTAGEKRSAMFVVRPVMPSTTTSCALCEIFPADTRGSAWRSRLHQVHECEYARLTGKSREFIKGHKYIGTAQQDATFGYTSILLQGRLAAQFIMVLQYLHSECLG
jgi:hypothetical protein